MISIIAGTNRNMSKTSIIAKCILDYLVSKGIKAQLLDFSDWEFSDLNHNYTAESLSTKITQAQDEYIFDIPKVIYILPEYNGGVPGFMKAFIDAISMREYPKNFKNKKALLIGVSSGRAGNNRGLESFTGVLNYLGTIVYPMKTPISTIEKLVENNQLTDKDTQKTLFNLLDRFILF